MPCHLFGTVNGVLGAVITVPSEAFNLLYRLQQALEQVVQGVGGLSHEKWREFATDRKSMPARNFLDVAYGRRRRVCILAARASLLLMLNHS